jgi:hypothetical protein
VLTTFVWIVAAGFAALPLYWSELGSDLYRRLFRGHVGTDDDRLHRHRRPRYGPPGILFWRAILQWLGGLGIVVMAVAVLPMLQIGGMQLFKAEAFDTPDKILPRAGTALRLADRRLRGAHRIVRGGLHDRGDARLRRLAHSMTTVATGGFSTKDGSIGAFRLHRPSSGSACVHDRGRLALPALYSGVRGKPMRLLRDDQVRAFFVILSGLVVLCLAGRDPGRIRRYRGALPRGRLQHHVDHDGHRLWLGRLQPMGPVRDRNLPDRHIHRRLLRLDLLRHQGVPLRGDVREHPPARPAHRLSVRRLREALQRPPAVRQCVGRRAELRVPVSGHLFRAGHRPEPDRP